MVADKPRNRLLAVIYASMAAGPIALAVIGAGALLSSAPLAVAIDPNEIVPAVGLGLWVFFLAMIVALIPNTLGVVAMAWVGGWNVGLRHPGVWMLAGGAMAGLPIWLLQSGPSSSDPVAFWAATGAASALVARRTVRRDD